MISSLTGTVTSVGLDKVVLEVGGLGLLLLTPPQVAAGVRTGSATTLQTTLVVREDSLTLYGFADPTSRDLFDLLMTVSGVGPRLALAMLSVLSPDALRTAVLADDLVSLTKVPGIGKKGAERLVLELRDKIAAFGSGDDAGAGATAQPTPAGGPSEASTAQVRAALTGLGWSTKQADDAIGRAGDAAGDDVGALLRAALRELSP